MLSSLRANCSGRARWGEKRGVQGERLTVSEHVTIQPVLWHVLYTCQSCMVSSVAVGGKRNRTVLLSTGTRGRKCGHTNNPKNLNEDASIRPTLQEMLKQVVQVARKCYQKETWNYKGNWRMPEWDWDTMVRKQRKHHSVAAEGRSHGSLTGMFYIYIQPVHTHIHIHKSSSIFLSYKDWV